jgi:hypothetical protein
MDQMSNMIHSTLLKSAERRRLNLRQHLVSSISLLNVSMFQRDKTVNIVLEN